VPSPRPVTLAALLLLVLALGAPAANADWTTYHGDPARTGTDPSSGAAAPFAPAWQSPDLGGAMWAQPLVYRGLVIVATESDDVVALSEATGQPVWRTSLGTPIDASTLPCGDISPTVGITSTPVIDPQSGTLFAVADVQSGSGAPEHDLVALDARTGAQRFREDVDPPGSTPAYQLQRPALALAGGRVQIGFGGNDGDCATYWGWLVSVPESGGAAAVWRSPDNESAIWAAGGPAVDAAGHVYAATGNGANTGSFEHGDTLEKWDAASHEIDWFAPTQWAQDNANDADLGSVSPALLPGGLVYQGGKDGNGYLARAAALGGIGGDLFEAPVCTSFGGTAVAGGTLYAPCTDGVRALAIGPSSFSVSWQGPGDANGSPIVAGGLVWVTATSNATLYGLDPASGAVRVTQSTPAMEHFVSPSASDGKLFLATDSTVEAWTIAAPVAAPTPPAPAPSASAPACGRRLTVRLVIPPRDRVVSAELKRGRAVLAHRRGRHLRTLALRAPAATFTVTLRERTAAGAHLRRTLVYRDCRLVARRA
jgi:outer membrane protein assembly factor BamB